jgi:hypothetical protein
MTRADKVALAVSLLLLVALYALLWSGNGPADQVRVAAGNKTRVYSLHEDLRIAISGLRGKSVIEVSHGRARFVASPCSGKVCLQAGWLDQAGETAACVPNGVMVSVAGRDERYDAINF